ncbi:MAG: VanZ family protein [Burkholderiales bacterium]|nr:VanZ family protein [Burkholderiales bacterium]
MPPARRLLLVVYVLLVVYATLYPLSGWRDPGGSALEFLAAGWPRHRTAFDLWANVAGYVPFGALAALSLRARLGAGGTVFASAAAGATLSLALETAQAFLPARIPSLADVAANVAGALVGALLGVRLAPALGADGRLARWRAALFEPAALPHVGLALVALWLFAQLNPATLLFGAGDLRDLVAAPAGGAHTAEFFVALEAAVAAANLIVFGLLVSAIAAPGAPVRTLVFALALAALAVRSAAYALLMETHRALAWATPGALAGLAAGALGVALLAGLPRTARLALAAVLAMAATALVNLAPPNPYIAETLRVWQQGHFLHFNGLTRLVAAAWPFAAAAYLIVLAARREARLG